MNPRMCNHDDLMAPINQSLTQLIDMGFYTTRLGIEEIRHHGNGVHPTVSVDDGCCCNEKSRVMASVTGGARKFDE